MHVTQVQHDELYALLSAVKMGEVSDTEAIQRLAQVFSLERQVIRTKTGEGRTEVVMGITSLPPERADAARLLALIRGHWHIEPQSHWVRDVTFDEDRSPVLCGNIPQVMAGLRNTVIGLMRWAGYTNIAAACRRFAAQPALALELIGITLEN